MCGEWGSRRKNHSKTGCINYFAHGVICLFAHSFYSVFKRNKNGFLSLALHSSGHVQVIDKCLYLSCPCFSTTQWFHDESLNKHPQLSWKTTPRIWKHRFACFCNCLLHLPLVKVLIILTVYNLSALIFADTNWYQREKYSAQESREGLRLLK